MSGVKTKSNPLWGRRIILNIESYYVGKDEKPLDVIKPDGGFTSIFRTIACIGDSLSSGEFESHNPDGSLNWNDMYEYSWGQFIARATGSKVYNFSKGGMTAKKYMTSFADERDFFSEDKLCQCYIMALGVNDILNQHMPLGTLDDIDTEDYHNNKDTFTGWYCAIIQRLKSMRPDAKFFLVTMPRGRNDEKQAEFAKHLGKICDFFDNCYLIDLYKYAPVYDEEFKKHFYLGGHMNPMGYKLTADMIMSYIDYIIRANPADFYQTGFIGTGKKY